jgi:uncharacterized protein (TIGR03382 family)
MLHSVVVAAGALVAGCTDPGEGVEYGQVESYATVSGYTTSSCSTAVVIGLSRQIADEISCANPTGLVKVTTGGNLQITGNAVLPYLSMKGKTDLEAVAQGRVVQINSAFRTVAQQYLLYRWYQLGRCSIPIAATPGNSNHESGRAVDVANYSSLISAMGAKGWAHDVPGDPVHFDHLSSPDIRGRDVLAFQKLWNRNHPEDLIAEDGDYGTQTGLRIAKSPAEGFPIGPNCLGTRQLEVVSVNGPDRVAPESKVHYSMTVKNEGTATWAGSTKLQLKTATSSTLHDASWTSDTVIATLGTEVAPMATGTIDFDVMTPAATEELPIFEELVLDDNGQNFGDIQLALTVVPGISEDGETSEGGEFGDDVQGGCNAGGGGAGGLIAFGLLGLVGNRRRRRA